jgi:hypothetical protein
MALTDSLHLLHVITCYNETLDVNNFGKVSKSQE